ncbi:MAG: DUF4838 domain-containing protein [Lentisphaerae bacterium]|jgi:hypothetical protein|nr:DUF4838 domain-containing protein [Lentisphaerota bacterium]MBT5604973.1 DUF4838 domain-containing protein [Lentisphaerota bacterium]MBT7057021.1 DUF4838 domain-containing protein [Lentisphaerota bacterium]MBT7844694.1 DUF4838 domain-containing protein [Lentisphaerota bacterium]
MLLARPNPGRGRTVGPWCLSLLCAGMMVAGASAGQERLDLVRDGYAHAVIAVPPDAGKVADFAARELKQFLDLATRSDIAISQAVPAEGPVILVGDTAESRERGLDVSELGRDGLRLLRSGRFVMVAGRDDKQYNIENYADHVDEAPHRGRGWRSREIKPEHGTLFAAYEFLERVVGVRWYYPGELGTSVSQKRDLTVGALDVTDEPRMVVRCMPGFGDWSIPGHTTWRMTDYTELGVTRPESTRWALRCRLSSLHRPVNHLPLTLRFYYRYRKTNAEFFALKEDGTRDIYWGKDTKNGSLCYSHPDVIRKIGDDAVAYFSGRKATELESAPWNARWDADRMQDIYFSLLPGDNYKGCHCERCQALVDPESPYGEYSAIVWSYARQVAARVYAAFPERRFTMLAYSHFRQVPKDMERLPPNVLIGATAVHLGNSRDNSVMETVFADIRRWSTYSQSPIFLWSYHIDRPQYDGIPQPRLWSAGRFYNELDGLNVDGIFLETLVSQGFQAHLDVYLNLRMMWDPTLDAEALIREYARRMYGAAADDVVEFLRVSEDKWVNGIIRCDKGRYRGAAYQDIVDIPAERWGKERGLTGLWEEVYTRDVIRQLGELMSAAEGKLRDADEVTRKRFQLFRKRFYGKLLARWRKDAPAHLQ